MKNRILPWIEEQAERRGDLCPGMREQMHANNEWAEVADLIEGAKILVLTIIEWCGVEGQTSAARR